MRPDQLIALIAAEHDARRHGRGQVLVDSWPDEDDRRGKAVDLIGHDDVGEIAVEHTRIETFPGQIKDRLAVQATFPRLGPEIRDRRDAGKFVMTVSPGAMRSVPFGHRRVVRRIVTDWVTDNLDEVALGDVLYGQHPEVPFRWALWRWLPDNIRVVGPDATVVRIRHTHPEDLEERRYERMGQVARDKLPKLAQGGAGTRRTVLVLEDKDQDTSGPKLVSKAMQHSVGDAWLPDVVYLLYLGCGDPLLCVVYEDDTWAHDAADFHWDSVPLDRCAQLRDLPTT